MSTDHRFRHRNKGLRKVCACPRRKWAKCDHSWYLNFRYRKGKHHRISLDRHAGGKHLSKAEAEALADDLRGAIRRGAYPPPTAPAPTSTPAEITFAKLGALWLEGNARTGSTHAGRLYGAPGGSSRTSSTTTAS